MDDARDKLIRQLQETIRQQQEVIVRQQAVIEQLSAKVTQLERQVDRLESGKSKPKGMPGNKLEPTKPLKEKAPRKHRERSFVRVRSVPTHRVEHALEECDGCGMRLPHGSIKRTREVIDVPLMPATVTEHVFIERRCYKCGKRCVPRDVLGDVAAGKSRLGVGLQSLIASLREVGRLPIATIRWHLDTFHQLKQKLLLATGRRRSLLSYSASLGPIAKRSAASSARLASPLTCTTNISFRTGG